MMRISTTITTIFKSPDGLTFAVRAAIAATDYVARKVGIGGIGGVSPTTIQTLDTFYGVANIVRLPNNINYFTRGLSQAEWRVGGVKYISSWCASVLFLAARVAGVTMWLQKNELLSLAGIAKTCGNIPIFRHVVRFGLARVANVVLVGAMSCIVLERAWALVRGQTDGHEVFAFFDMVNNLSEIALIAMTFSGVVSVWALALAACVVAPTGIIAALLFPLDPLPPVSPRGGGENGPTHNGPPPQNPPLQAVVQQQVGVQIPPVVLPQSSVALASQPNSVVIPINSTPRRGE
jgi:hypothetical protein